MRNQSFGVEDHISGMQTHCQEQKQVAQHLGPFFQHDAFSARLGQHPAALGRDGYLALLGTLGSGGVDAVVVPGIETLSSDQIIQEIMLWDLLSRGVRVLSTHDDDLAVLDDQYPGPTRMLIRDVLARVEEHAETMAHRPMDRPAGGTDVIIELLASVEDAVVPGSAAAGL